MTSPRRVRRGERHFDNLVCVRRFATATSPATLRGCHTSSTFRPNAFSVLSPSQCRTRARDMTGSRCRQARCVRVLLLARRGRHRFTTTVEICQRSLMQDPRRSYPRFPQPLRRHSRYCIVRRTKQHGYVSRFGRCDATSRRITYRLQLSASPFHVGGPMSVLRSIVGGLPCAVCVRGTCR